MESEKYPYGRHSEARNEYTDLEHPRDDMWICLECGNALCGFVFNEDGEVENTRPDEDADWNHGYIWDDPYEEPTSYVCTDCEVEITEETVISTEDHPLGGYVEFYNRVMAIRREMYQHHRID